MAYLERGQFTICQKTFKLGSVYNMVTHVSKWQRMYWPDNGGNGFLCLEIENSRCQYQKLPIGCSLYMYSIHGSWIISWNLKESRVKSQESSSFLRLPETSSYQTTLLGFFFCTNDYGIQNKCSKRTWNRKANKQMILFTVSGVASLGFSFSFTGYWPSLQASLNVATPPSLGSYNLERF